MNKKINVDSCDTVNDHVKRAVLSCPEMQKLHFINILNDDVFRYIRSEKGLALEQQSVVIIVPTVSSCFDIVEVLQAILGQQNVQAIYPHTVQTLDNATKPSVLVLPYMVLQLTKALEKISALSISAVLVVSSKEHEQLMAGSVRLLSNQLPESSPVVFVAETIAALQDASDTKIQAPKVSKTKEKKVVKSEPTIELIVEALDEVAIVEPVIEQFEEKNTTDELPAEHHIVLVDRNYKRSYLRNRLKSSNKKTLIITRTRHNAHRLEEYLYQGKVRSRILHANLSEDAKEKVIERFITGDLSVLLLPESVAQTIELKGVDDIIFFDLPDVGAEFKERVSVIGERFQVNNTSSIVNLDEAPWVDAMEEELKWSIPKIQPAPPQRSHNILRIKNRTNNKEKVEKTEKRVGVNRGLRKMGGKTPLNKKKNNQFPPKVSKDSFNDQSFDHQAADPFNSIGQSIVNENRNPFAFDSFEASVSRQNKQRVKQLFSRKEKPQKEVQSDFNVNKTERKNVKVVHRKKRTFDIDGNQ